MKDLETIEANIEQLSLPENYEDKLRSIRWLCVETKRLNAEVKRLRKEINQLPIDLHESLDMILEEHYPELRESVMAMFGDAWGNNLTGYEE
jgi:hypothetical protein